jgi:hypothetical protein
MKRRMTMGMLASACSVQNSWELMDAVPVTIGRIGSPNSMRVGSPRVGIEVMSGNRRLVVLAVFHVALGVVTGVLAHVVLSTPFGLARILAVPFVATALCQALLLATWAVASQTQVWNRLAGLVIGGACLEMLVAPDFRRELLGTSSITIVVTTATLLVVRWLGVRFTRQSGPGQPESHEPEGLKFSIRGQMIFTAAVALLCALARELQATPNRVLLLILDWALCFVAVGLVSLWAALGQAKPLRRTPVVFILSPVLGAFFALAVGADSDGWIYILLIMLLYPTTLLGSLLIVRSCGYRLVRSAVGSLVP